MDKHLRMLLMLTGMFVFFQIVLVGIDLYLSSMGSVFNSQLLKELFFSPAFITAFLHLILAQGFIYFLYVYFLWCICDALSELFSLKNSSSLLLCFFVWLDSMFLLLSLNLYLVPHSQITIAIHKYFFNEGQIDFGIKCTLILTGTVLLFAILLWLLKLILDIKTNNFPLKQRFLILMMISLSLFGLSPVFYDHTVAITGATEKKPNIIIIGFDALRPDYLSFFNKTQFSTPHFDAFLKEAIVFDEAYTPLARTTPSWAGFLTGKYPIKTQVRENNEVINSAPIANSLAESLKQIGYETFYATDDRRYNQIDEKFGFNHVIGPDGKVPDYLIGSLNDFPLSNIIAPTFLGKYLFPYNHANHGSYYTFRPDDFLFEIKQMLAKNPAKPIFLAVHFNVSGWPFGWFNDKLPYNVTSYNAYQAGVRMSDTLFDEFMLMLKEKKLLESALVILISDHGVALGLPNDRSVQEKNYRGKNKTLPLLRTKYAEKKEITFREELTHSLNHKNYGVDTAYGYGGDVLSLKQTHILLAFKSFGFAFGSPHRVSGRALSLDVAPTLSILLSLPLAHDVDGISLLPYVYDASLALGNNRPIYIENAFSPDEIMLPTIDKNKVVKNSLDFFNVNFATGEVFLSPYWANLIIANKQRMVLQGDWLLAWYPPSKKIKFVPSKKNEKQLKMQTFRFPPYFVLLNVKTGEWATEWDQPLVKRAPMLALSNHLSEFYKNEMQIYQEKTEKNF